MGAKGPGLSEWPTETGRTPDWRNWQHRQQRLEGGLAVILLPAFHQSHFVCRRPDGKADATRACVRDIAANIGDPLSRATRRILEESLDVKEGIPFIFSTKKRAPKKMPSLRENNVLSKTQQINSKVAN
jgi:hypothetical protein